MADGGLQRQRISEERQHCPPDPYPPVSGKLATGSGQPALQPPCACCDPGKKINEVQQDTAFLKPERPPRCPVERPCDQRHRKVDSRCYRNQPARKSLRMIRGALCEAAQ